MGSGQTLNALGELLRDAAEQRRKDEEYQKRLARWAIRLRAKAQNLSREELIEHVAWLFVFHHEEKKLGRSWKQIAEGAETMGTVTTAQRDAFRDELVSLAKAQLVQKGKYRQGANRTNAAKATAKRIVRDKWQALPASKRMQRGAVVRFAVRTAPVVPGTTVDGIRRWVADFRRESRRR